MSPGAHLLISWLSGVEVLKATRQRALVALSGIAPDIDGLGAVIDKVSSTTNFYFEYHHKLGHSILSAVVVATIAAVLASSQKWAVFTLSFIAVHLHILCDVIGSKGPDGYQWPIYYLYPISSDLQLTWSGQWLLSGWQNQLIMLCLFIASGYYAVRKKITFLEVFSTRLDREAFKMFDRYVGKKSYPKK